MLSGLVATAKLDLYYSEVVKIPETFTNDTPTFIQNTASAVETAGLLLWKTGYPHRRISHTPNPHRTQNSEKHWFLQSANAGRAKQPSEESDVPTAMQRSHKYKYTTGVAQTRVWRIQHHEGF